MVLACPSRLLVTSFVKKAPALHTVRRQQSIKPIVGYPFKLSCLASQAQVCGVSMAPDAAVTVASDPKLKEIRELMVKSGGLAALLVPSSDPHLLEYAPVHQRRRAFLSGFTGSAGTLVVTMDEALLWTDGRYFLQAETELSPEWTLMKAGTKGCPRISEWLAKSLKEGDKVGFDASVHPQSEVNTYKEAIAKKGSQMVATETNLVDSIWGSDRPGVPSDMVRIHPEAIAGESLSSKLTRLRQDMETNEAGALFVGKLEEIAWILNLRGNDEPYTPIFISYLLIDKDTATLFIDLKKVPVEVSTYLKEFGVGIRPYEDVEGCVTSSVSSGLKIWMDPDLVNSSIFNAANKGKSSESKDEGVVSKSTPITSYMAEKNEIEVKGMQEAHLRDAAAISEFLSWFEEEMKTGRVFTEVDVHRELTACRAKQDGFVSLSFPTIAGADENGAIIHYNPTEENCKTVTSSTMLLVDSGGQYDCGTTDITRTVHTGDPTAHQKLCFTKVLQGHIALASAIFPEDTPGVALDVLARGPLWNLGLDYRHGTGHGVGSHMCVHEGPISISNRYASNMGRQGLKEGMIVSNEPGYYEDGSFGCRIENLVVIKKVETPHSFGGTKYLGFENITFVPFQRKLMDESILSPLEKAWLNEYHSQVWAKVSPRVTGQTLEWLSQNTAPIATA